MPDADWKDRRSTSDVFEKAFSDHVKDDNQKFTEIIEKIHKIDTSLNGITILLTETLKSQMQLTAQSQSMTLKHNEFLYGEKGVAVQLDRLNELEQGRKATIRTMMACIIGIVIKLIFDVFKYVTTRS